MLWCINTYALLFRPPTRWGEVHVLRQPMNIARRHLFVRSEPLLASNPQAANKCLQWGLDKPFRSDKVAGKCNGISWARFAWRPEKLSLGRNADELNALAARFWLSRLISVRSSARISSMRFASGWICEAIAACMIMSGKRSRETSSESNPPPPLA